MASERELEQIRERVSLIELVSSYTRMKKSGNRYAGLCPFHGDKDPSFSVNDDSKLWHCFGCKKGGDLFSFVMEIENIDFGEAVEMLARRAGVTLTDKTGADPGRREKKDRVRAINDLAVKFFYKVLTGSEFGGKFLDYLYGRGVTKDQIKSFKIGASFEAWDKLIIAMGKKGFSSQELAIAGLAIHNTDRDSYYDRFRNRLMFPLFNVVGDVVGFAGRAYSDDMPKYLNTPETPLFDKGKLLYGLDRAKKHIEKEGVIVTEGYMDVIALHGAGFTSAVASMGTALTGDHVNLLKRYCNRAYLAYDSDFAGDSASMRGIEMLVESEFDVRVVSLPKGEDPDSLVKKKGPDGFKKYLDSAQDYFDFFVDKHIDRTGGETATQKAEIVRVIAPLISQSPNEILQAEQKRRLADRLDITEKQVYSVISMMKDRKRTGGPAADPASALTSGGGKVEKEILESIFTSRRNAEKIIKELQAEDFSDDRYGGLFAYCAKFMEQNDSFDPNEFLNAVHPQAVVRELSSLNLVPGEKADKLDGMVDSRLEMFTKGVLDKEIGSIKRRMEAASKSGDRDAESRLLSKFNQLMKQKFKS